MEFKNGDHVRTARILQPRDYSPIAIAQRKQRAFGVVCRHSDTHGLCFEIMHNDGSFAYYDPDELVKAINVIEVDQWTSTGNIKEQDFNTVGLQDVEGGDSLAAKQIFGGSFRRKTVGEDEHPTMGTVWFKRGPDGKCELYKYNYDSSG